MQNSRTVLFSYTGAVIIAAIAWHLRDNGDWIAPPEADKLQNPFAGEKATSAGENLFSFNCERCHGSYGKGDGVDGKKLNPHPADLTSEKVQKQTDGAIFWKLSNGRSPMDAFKNKLSEKERWKLVNYIRQLAKSS